MTVAPREIFRHDRSETGHHPLPEPECPFVTSFGTGGSECRVESWSPLSSPVLKSHCRRSSLSSVGRHPFDPQRRRRQAKLGRGEVGRTGRCYRDGTGLGWVDRGPGFSSTRRTRKVNHRVRSAWTSTVGTGTGEVFGCPFTRDKYHGSYTQCTRMGGPTCVFRDSSDVDPVGEGTHVSSGLHR